MNHRPESSEPEISEGKVEVDCEFCNQRYVFRAEDVPGLFDTPRGDSDSPPDEPMPPGTVVH